MPTYRLFITLMLLVAVAANGVAATSHSALAARLDEPAPEAPRAIKQRVKDITTVLGARENILSGTGLVIGLNGTGDDGMMAQQLLRNYLERMDGITPEKLGGDNIAAVHVTAILPPFAGRDTKIDVTVSSIDDAKSLGGGTLLITPLKGADARVYAVAYGNLDVGGFSVQGASASIVKNHPTVGRITGGAIVEEDVGISLAATLAEDGFVKLMLHQADFASATRLAETVNESYPGTATPIDGRTVQVTLPPESATEDKVIDFVSKLGFLEMVPDASAKVIIDPRWGMIVANEHVRIGLVTFAHGNITVVIREDTNVSQPAPFGQGNTQVTSATSIEVTEHKARIHVLEPGVGVRELAEALNKLGVTPSDLSAIFQGIRDVGALHADLVIK